MKLKLFATLSLTVAVLASCQDHHFVPIEQADKIKLPSGQTAAAKSFAEGPMAQKQVMAEAATRRYAPPRNAPFRESAIPKKPGRVIVEGKLELGAAQKKRDFTGFTVYVIVRPPDIKGPAIAAARYGASSFPLDFRLDTNDLMMAAPPDPDAKVMIEVRLNKNPDPMIRGAGDVWGITKEPVKVGSTNVIITADQDR